MPNLESITEFRRGIRYEGIARRRDGSVRERRIEEEVVIFRPKSWLARLLGRRLLRLPMEVVAAFFVVEHVGHPVTVSRRYYAEDGTEVDTWIETFPADSRTFVAAQMKQNGGDPYQRAVREN